MNNNKTILIIDDAVISCNILSKNFSDEYNILIAQDGAQAVDILSHKYGEIDLVLLDLVLPKLSGQEVLKYMQKNEKLKFIPVIAITGIENMEKAGEALDLGAMEIFTKPFNIKIMRQRIKNVLDVVEKRNDINNANEFIKWRASRYSEVVTAKAICNIEFCVTLDEVSSISMNFGSNMVEQWETTWTDFLQHFIKEFVNTDYIPLAFHTFSRENLLENHKKGNSEVQIDLIFSFANGEDIWGRTFAYLIEDTEGRVYCNFYINDITEEKKALIALQQKVELDSVTTLYNRSYAESMINQNLKNTVIPGAFIILDIDNFKLVNDTMGHIYGDALLSEIGRCCKQFMGPGDVAGRYGGDEFIIFLAGIDKNRAESKVNELHCSLNKVFSQITSFFTFSCSMGVAMFPYDGESYMDLLSKADAALYYSKDLGKNQCNFYNSKMRWRTNESRPATEKETVKNENGANFRDNMCEYVFRILSDVSDIVKAIPMVFDLVGRSRAISRISLFIVKSQGKFLGDYFEWNNKGVGSSCAETHFITENFLEELESGFDTEGRLTVPDISKIKNLQLRNWCEQRGSLSIMLQKILNEQGEVYGLIGFEQCDRKRYDNGKKNNFVENFAMLVGVFFIKQARMKLLSGYYQMNKMILNSTGTVVYIIDKNNYDLLYCNDTSKNILPDNKKLLKCYKELKNNTIPCEDCPLHNKTGVGYERPLLFENKQKQLWQEFIVEESCLYNGNETAMICVCDVTERNNLESKLKIYAKEDVLTGLSTRARFFLETEKMLQENQGTDYALFVLNIEHFKMINDLYGVDFGDKVLAFIASTLKDMYRNKATIGRLYADRFTVCIPKKIFDPALFIDVITKEFTNLDYKFKIIVDLGIYNIDDLNVPVRQMVDRAKIALDTIRGSYQNCFAYYDNAWREKLMLEHQLMAELEEAMDNHEIVPYYQPYFDLKTKKVLGAEALARWVHPKLGVLSPTLFIPIFERSGMIERLDHYMWREVCEFIAGERKSNKAILPISVNISRVNFYNPNLAENIMALVQQYSVPPEMLRLEVTESAYAQGEAMMFNTIKQLQAYGFKVLMDDFGSGYSSLNMLKDIEVDILKIDMHFLGYCENATRAYKILLAVADLGRRLEIPVIAEGIETIEDTDKLRNMGIDAGQGFYFAMPMPAKAFIKLLAGLEKLV